jgi:hypothetical protein
MNTKKLAMTIALGTLMTAASAGAMAANMGFDETGSQWLKKVSNTPSTVTRAEVKNQVLMARQQGTLEINNTTYPVTTDSNAPPRTRSAVRAEAIESVQNGVISDLYIGG